ncbi:MAG: hypothetical protein K9L60_14250 [Methylovulum sp.]|nr:hypothetical protein [Methylovulum sp.]MCF8000101.1 hypothetical protein [Methylovulum sp.]
MNKQKSTKSWLIALAVSACLPTVASAFPGFVEPTGAQGCTSCHLDAEGNGYKPGILEASKSPLGLIEGLKAFLKPAILVTNTAPVLHPINPKWDVTVGEIPLTIPLQVTDKEDDTFTLHGSAPTGYTVSNVYTRNSLPTIDFKWSPTAAQANKVYPIRVYVKETGTGRSLQSNTISANIQVWPARSTLSKNVSQFIMQGAQWKNNTLSLSGSLTFKSSLTSAQRTAALASLTMNVTSASGAVISQPVKLAPSSTGSWTKSFILNASSVPCTVKISYEGIKAARYVSLTPLETCVK